MDWQEVENIAGEVEVLKGVVEEGLSGRISIVFYVPLYQYTQIYD
jgi:hypothetical protein